MVTPKERVRGIDRATHRDQRMIESITPQKLGGQIGKCDKFLIREQEKVTLRAQNRVRIES